MQLSCSVKPTECNFFLEWYPVLYYDHANTQNETSLFLQSQKRVLQINLAKHLSLPDKIWRYLQHCIFDSTLLNVDVSVKFDTFKKVASVLWVWGCKVSDRYSAIL